MKKTDFGCVENFSVLIPYKQLEQLLLCANNLERLQQDLKRTREELCALRGMYFEALEKIAEINRYL